MQINLSNTPIYSKIAAFGAYRGDLHVSNNELVEKIDSSDEWIRQRTGIISRRRESTKNIVQMAIIAAQEAIKRAGTDPATIDAIIVATVTNPAPTPAAAPQVCWAIGAQNAMAYDLSAGCAGYCYAICQADALIKAGVAKKVLVIGAEKLSDIIDDTDRSISFLLADGAGAALVYASSEEGIFESVIGSDGSMASAINMTYSNQEAQQKGVRSTLRQDGKSVFRWAVWHMAKVAKEALSKAGVRAEHLAAFVPHQANIRIIQELAKQIGLPDQVTIAQDIQYTGNTSSASIPLAAHALLQENPQLSGKLALQIGFGSGLAYAAQVVVLP